MHSIFSAERVLFRLRRFRERLWVRPLIICLLSIATVFTAKIADGYPLQDWAPDVSPGSVESLLTVMASSMLVIATFAVGSMVAAYASASNIATPRAFRLVVADDVSQNALSTFIGAFIFSIVALTAVLNDFFAVAGRFSIFSLTLMVLAVVIFTFVRWVDRIARLGRMETSIKKVESATASAMRDRQRLPHLCGIDCAKPAPSGDEVYSDDVGYVQRLCGNADDGARGQQLRQLWVWMAHFWCPCNAAVGWMHLKVPKTPSWAAGQRKKGAYAPANIIAFIARLMPRMLSTRLKL